MTTAADIITKALRLFGIIDQTETPQPADITNCAAILNDLLRSEMADGAVQFLMRRTEVQLPAGVPGGIYFFFIGTSDGTYLVQQDAVAVKAMWVKDIGQTVNRETRTASFSDVVRTTQPGMITKWHQERQTDGSVRVTAWQPPRASVAALIEYGARLPPITDGNSPVTLPPEGIHDATLLLGRRICSSYGRDLNAVGVVAQDAERVNARWRDWARGQQWLRLVRA